MSVAVELRDQFLKQKSLRFNSAGALVIKDDAAGTEVAAAGLAAVGDAVADPAALTSEPLTDNSAGTANTTVQAIPDPTDTPADADALRDDIVANVLPALRNNFADVAAQTNALNADVAEIRTQLIALLDSLEAAGTIAT